MENNINNSPPNIIQELADLFFQEKEAKYFIITNLKKENLDDYYCLKINPDSVELVEQKNNQKIQNRFKFKEDTLTDEATGFWQEEMKKIYVDFIEHHNELLYAKNNSQKELSRQDLANIYGGADTSPLQTFSFHDAGASYQLKLGAGKNPTIELLKKTGIISSQDEVYSSKNRGLGQRCIDALKSFFCWKSTTLEQIEKASDLGTAFTIALERGGTEVKQIDGSWTIGKHVRIDSKTGRIELGRNLNKYGHPVAIKKIVHAVKKEDQLEPEKITSSQPVQTTPVKKESTAKEKLEQFESDLVRSKTELFTQDILRGDSEEKFASREQIIGRLLAMSPEAKKEVLRLKDNYMMLGVPIPEQIDDTVRQPLLVVQRSIEEMVIPRDQQTEVNELRSRLTAEITKLNEEDRILAHFIYFKLIPDERELGLRNLEQLLIVLRSMPELESLKSELENLRTQQKTVITKEGYLALQRKQEELIRKTEELNDVLKRFKALFDFIKPSNITPEETVKYDQFYQNIIQKMFHLDQIQEQKRVCEALSEQIRADLQELKGRAFESVSVERGQLFLPFNSEENLPYLLMNDEKIDLFNSRNNPFVLQSEKYLLIYNEEKKLWEVHEKDSSIVYKSSDSKTIHYFDEKGQLHRLTQYNNRPIYLFFGEPVTAEPKYALIKNGAHWTKVQIEKAGIINERDKQLITYETLVKKDRSEARTFTVNPKQDEERSYLSEQPFLLIKDRENITLYGLFEQETKGRFGIGTRKEIQAVPIF